MFKEITPQILNEWMLASDVILIDVREPSEFDQERIQNSLLMPLSTIVYEQLPLSGKRRIVFHCRSGKRSQLACERIIDSLDDNVELYSLEGGILAWREAGFPVSSGPITLPAHPHKSVCLSGMKCPLSFKTCAHRLCFVSGLAIFILIALSAFVTPYFVWGLVCLAVGLLIAAFCV